VCKTLQTEDDPNLKGSGGRGDAVDEGLRPAEILGIHDEVPRPLVDFMIRKENVEAGKISSMIFLSTAPNEKVVEGLYRHFVKSTNRLAGLEIDLSGALVIGKSIRPVKCLRDWSQGDLNHYKLWIGNLCYTEDQDMEDDKTSMTQIGVCLFELCRQYFALASDARSSAGVGPQRSEATGLDYLILNLKLGLFSGLDPERHDRR